MELTKDIVLKIAKSARLKFKENELESIQDDLRNILTYIDILNEVDTENVEPLVYINESLKDLREDTVRVSLDVEEVMKNAPAAEEEAIIVPKVVGE